MRDTLIRALALMMSTLLVLAGTLAMVNGSWGELQAEPLTASAPYSQMAYA